MQQSLVSAPNRIRQNETIGRIDLLWIEATYSERERIDQSERPKFAMNVFEAGSVGRNASPAGCAYGADLLSALNYAIRGDRIFL